MQTLVGVVRYLVALLVCYGLTAIAAYAGGGLESLSTFAKKSSAASQSVASTDVPDDTNTDNKTALSDEEQEALNSEAAFKLLLKKNIPLTPEQIVRLRQQIDLAQKAAAAAPNTPPKPVSTTLMINLSPGATAPAIRLSQGYISSLVFVDSTGAPWPIAGYQIGNPRATNVQWDGKSNVLMLQAVNAYNDGNLVIRLANLVTPITLELISGQPVVDFRVDIHVSGMGPNAQPVTSSNLPGTANQVLLNVLDGIRPEQGQDLLIEGGYCQGWSVSDKMYLRTRFTLLSPGWLAKMVSSDGMQAYELPKSSSVMISRDGDPLVLTVEGG